MNDTPIEAMSQCEIPRPILRSSVWPRRHRQVSCTGPPGTVCGQCGFYGYGMQHPNSCYRYYVVKVSEHGAAFPSETPSCQHFAPRWPGRNEK
jgi:hypothetical protein